MSAKVKKHTLICSSILLVCFLVCAAGYDPYTALAIEDVRYQEDTLRVFVRGGEIIAIELSRPDDTMKYSLEIDEVEAGKMVWVIVRYRELDVEVNQVQLPKTSEAVLVKNDKQICIYSFDQALIQLLKAVPGELQGRYSTRYYDAFRKTRSWGLLLVMAYFILNELGVFTDQKSEPA